MTDENSTINGQNKTHMNWIVEPYLNLLWHSVHNPITNRTTFPKDQGYKELRSIAERNKPINSLNNEIKSLLIKEEWIIPPLSDDKLAKRFFLKIVSLEAHTVCNQACYFCPVSIDPRKDHFMSMELYENIVSQLAEFKDTIESVFMISYNEPTVDKNFIEQIKILRKYGLVPAVNTNGTGLTPARSDAMMEMGGIGFLSINLSTMDRDSYKTDRQGDHIKTVMRNLDYIKNKKVAEIMDIAVLGKGDEPHHKDFKEIAEYFADSYFNVKYWVVRDRAGYLEVGRKTNTPHKKLKGCEMIGSRPLQHLHINPKGECFLCCEDYENTYIVGDLNKETVNEVLAGPEMMKMRRWIYGIEEAPDDFICRHCVNAITPEETPNLLSKSLKAPFSLIKNIAQRSISS
ncbi:MAG: radical SAM/SPASM domain-containing protein [Thermodesulfobacteriota bacterium]